MASQIFSVFLKEFFPGLQFFIKLRYSAPLIGFIMENIMNTLIICLLIAAILPYLAKIPVMKAMNKAGGYDNHHPREQAERLQGEGARAWSAHKNSFESLIVFTAAITTALATQHVTTFVQALAVIHIISRLAYHVCYLKDLATPRTLIWAVGLLCSLIILGTCIQ